MFDNDRKPQELPSNLQAHEKLAPGHPVMRQFFHGNDDAFWRRLYDVTASVLPVRSVHERFDIRLKPGLTYETLGTDLPTLYHLRMLIQLMQCKRVLEVGTFIGVSTMFLADALPADGRITTIEIGAEFAAIAEENFTRNGFGSSIELVNSDVKDAMPWLVGFGETFDLIFLDGSKQDYGILLQSLLDLLLPGGLLFVDNVYFHGDVLNEEPSSEKARGVRDLLMKVEAIDWAKVIIPHGDGHLLLLKPRV